MYYIWVMTNEILIFEIKITVNYNIFLSVFTDGVSDGQIQSVKTL
jgi:hypothetical protein